MKRLVLFLMLVISSAGFAKDPKPKEPPAPPVMKSGIPVFDAVVGINTLSSWLNDLLHNIEVIVRFEEWYEQAAMLEDNLQGLGSGALYQALGSITADIELLKGEHTIAQLLALDPDSSHFDRDVLSILGSTGNVILQMPEDVRGSVSTYDIDLDADSMASYQARIDEYMDERQYYAGVESASASRLSTITSLEGLAGSLGDDDEMKALQVNAAITAQAVRSLEQSIQLSQVEAQQKALENAHRLKMMQDLIVQLELLRHANEIRRTDVDYENADATLEGLF